MLYQANWRVTGLPGGDLLPGETREIDDETAAPLIATGTVFPVDPQSLETCLGCGAPRSDFKNPQAWGSHKKKCKLADPETKPDEPPVQE